MSFSHYCFSNPTRQFNHIMWIMVSLQTSHKMSMHSIVCPCAMRGFSATNTTLPVLLPHHVQGNQRKRCDHKWTPHQTHGYFQEILKLLLCRCYGEWWWIAKGFDITSSFSHFCKKQKTLVAIKLPASQHEKGFLFEDNINQHFM